MKKIISFVTVIGLVVTMLAIGCSPQATPTPSSTSTPSPAFTQIATPKPTTAAWKPTKNITWLVPNAPGGGFDAISRAIAKTMLKYLPTGVNVVVENKPGAGGRLANTYVWRAKPDGYTVGIINGVGAAAEAATLAEAIDYDFEKFAYFAQINYVPIMISVPKNSPYKSLDDLRKVSKPLRVPTSGVGESDYFNGVIMCKALGIPMTTVAGYGSSNDCMLGTIRGDSDLCFWSTAALSFVQSGDLIPLAIIDKKRFETFPNVPCSPELGLTGEEFTNLYSTLRLIYGPPNTPEPVFSYYKELSRSVLNDADFLAWAKGVSQPMQYDSAEEGMKFLHGTATIYRKYKDAIAAASKEISG